MKQMFLSPLSPVLLHSLIVSDDQALELDIQSRFVSHRSLKCHFYLNVVLFLVISTIESFTPNCRGSGSVVDILITYDNKMISY